MERQQTYKYRVENKKYCLSQKLDLMKLQAEQWKDSQMMEATAAGDLRAAHKTLPDYQRAAEHVKKPDG